MTNCVDGYQANRLLGQTTHMRMLRWELGRAGGINTTTYEKENEVRHVTYEDQAATCQQLTLVLAINLPEVAYA